MPILDFLGLYHFLFGLETIGVSLIIIWWLMFEKKAISILAANLNSGRSYYITAVQIFLNILTSLELFAPPAAAVGKLKKRTLRCDLLLSCKKPFQFWQEIWIQAVVILLQLYPSLIGEHMSLTPWKLCHALSWTHNSHTLFCIHMYLLDLCSYVRNI